MLFPMMETQIASKILNKTADISKRLVYMYQFNPQSFLTDPCVVLRKQR